MDSGKIGDIFCTQKNKVGDFRNSIGHISVMVNFNYPSKLINFHLKILHRQPRHSGCQSFYFTF